MNTTAGHGRRTKGRKQKEFFTILHPSPSSSSSPWSLFPVSTAMRAPRQDFSLLQFPTTSGPILLFRAQPSVLSAWRLLELSTKPHSGIQKHPKYILSWFPTIEPLGSWNITRPQFEVPSTWSPKTREFSWLCGSCSLHLELCCPPWQQPQEAKWALD